MPIGADLFNRTSCLCLINRLANEQSEDRLNSYRFPDMKVLELIQRVEILPMESVPA